MISNATHVSFKTYQRTQTRGFNLPTANWVATSFLQGGSTSCDKVLKAAFDSSNPYDAECVDGYAVIDFYAKSGKFHPGLDNAIPPGVCNDYCDCTGRKCGWRFTVPCVPDIVITDYCVEETDPSLTVVKETPAPVAPGEPTVAPTVSPAPSMCIDGIGSQAVDSDIENSSTENRSLDPPEEVPVTTRDVFTGENATFNVDPTEFSVGQDFAASDIPAIAVMYLSENGAKCDLWSNVQQNFTARCGETAETTSITIYVADTADGNVLTDADAIPNAGLCTEALSEYPRKAAYFYDVPCVDECGTFEEMRKAPPKEGEPTPSPSVSPSPTFNPTREYCVEIEPQGEEQTQCQYSADFVEHVTSNGTHVTVDVLQLFTEENESVDWIATVYPEYESDSCRKVTSAANTGVAVEQITAECTNDWAEIEVFVYDSAGEPNEGSDPQAPYVCNAATIASSSSDSGHICSYTIQVPCVEQLDETCTGTATPSASPSFITTFTSTGSTTDRPTSTPAEVCIKPVDATGKLCRTLMTTGDPDDTTADDTSSVAVGTVCMEPTEGSPLYLDVTVSSTGDYTLVSSAIWIGEDISTVSSNSDTGTPDASSFPYTWSSSSTGESTWETTIRVGASDTCSEDMTEFMLSSLVQVTVQQGDEVSSVEAFAVEDTECATTQTVSTDADVATLTSDEVSVSLSYSDVPTDAETVTMTFAFHEIGTYENNDGLIVFINKASPDGVRIDLGPFENDDSLENPTNKQSGQAASDSSVEWSREILSGVGDNNDKVHEIVITLPTSYFSSGTFDAELMLQINFAGDQQGTVENMDITANGNWCEDTPSVYAGIEMLVNCECVEDSEICIETGVDNVKEECHELLVGADVSAGTVCIEAVDDATKFQITYTASNDYTLLTGEFWIGDDIIDVPTDEDGALDTESFPYFFCNSTGEETWVAKFDMKWSYNCLTMDTFSLSAVGQATVAKMNVTSGEISEDTEVIAFAYEHENNGDNYFSWFDIQMNCECIPDEGTTEPPEDENPTDDLCVQTETFARKECHDVFSTNGDLPAGSVCVEVSEDSEHLEVSFEATGDWALITTEFWVGDDIADVPSDQDGGDLDTESFPFFWCNSTGETSYTSKVDLKWSYLCEDQDNFSLALVTQVTMAQVDSNGEIIEDTEFISFASEYDVADLYGWFDVSVVCECPDDSDSTRRLEFATADLPCDRDLEIANEDFESGSTDGWNNGLVARDTSYGHFLGRLGRENPMVSKVFDVSTEAESVHVGFSLYTIGSVSWKRADKVHVKVGIEDIDLGDFNNAVNKGTTEGIKWSRAVDIADSNVHHIDLEFSREYYVSGELSLAFEVALKESIAKKSAGVDNLVITALGVNSCGDATADVLSSASGFKLSSLNAAEPEVDGDDEDGRGYCRSEDFPCGKEEGMVNVCHYSITSGYQTYCLKEQDSDLVRTYPDDYCGPCTGGYGSTMNKHKVP